MPKSFLFPECEIANSNSARNCNGFWPPSEARRLLPICNFLSGAGGETRPRTFLLAVARKNFSALLALTHLLMGP